MGFSRDIDSWINATRLSRDVVLRKTGLDMMTGVAFRSPVKTGRFRASHRLSVNKVDASVEPDVGGPVDVSLGGILSDAATTLASAKWGDTIHLTNNLPYARPLENGSSAQTNYEPDGIYGATFQETASKLARIIRENRPR